MTDNIMSIPSMLIVVSNLQVPYLFHEEHWGTISYPILSTSEYTKVTVLPFSPHIKF